MLPTLLFTGKGGSGTVECHACARQCTIGPGEAGFCKVRSNEGLAAFHQSNGDGAQTG